MDGDKDEALKHRRGVPLGGQSATYTDEQVSVVRKIMQENNYYKILGLKRSCSKEDVHKAYKKLSLKVHPDKNSAPGAEEAFKMLSKAFLCLSNEESRKIYDGIRLDEPVYQRRNGYGGGGGGSVNRSRFFDEFMEGLKRCLVVILFSMIPIALVAWMVVSSIEEKPPIYSIRMDNPYNISFTTQKGSEYYVQSANFEQEHPPNSPQRVAIEEQVDAHHHLRHLQRCISEMRSFHDYGNMRKLGAQCDALKRFEDMLE